MKFRPMDHKRFTILNRFVNRGTEILYHHPSELRDFFKVTKRNSNLDANRLFQITIYNNQVYAKRDLQHQHPLSVEAMLYRFRDVHLVLQLFKTSQALNVYDEVFHTMDDNHYFAQLASVPCEPLHLLRVHDELIKNRKLMRNTKGLENREIVREDIQMLQQLPPDGLLQLIFGRYSDEVVSKKDLKHELRRVLKLAVHIQRQANTIQRR